MRTLSRGKIEGKNKQERLDEKSKKEFVEQAIFLFLSLGAHPTRLFTHKRVDPGKQF